MDINPLAHDAAKQPLSSLDPTALQRSVQKTNDPKARAEAVATQLESIFMGMVLKAMRDTVPEDGLAGKSMGGKNYVEMLDQQYAQLGAIPKDPRFHDVLVRQIMQSPESTNRAMKSMK